MRLLRTFPLTAFLLVVIALGAYCAALESVELLLLCGTLAALSWFVTEGPRGRTLPRWGSTALVIAVAGSGVIDFIRHPGDVPGVLGRFSIALTLVKLYDRRTARDHAQLMGLSLLLVLVGCMRSQTLLFGVFMVVYWVLGVYVLMLYQLFAAREAELATRRAAWTGDHEARGPGPGPTSGPHVGLHFRLLVTVVATLGLAMSALLFLIFPRSLGERLPVPGFGSRARTTGFVDQISLDAGTRITNSRRVAFHVSLRDGNGDPLELVTPFLMRGAVLEAYDDGRWTSVATGSRPLATDGRTLRRLAPARLVSPPTIHQRLRFPVPTHTVFAGHVPVAVGTDRPRQLAYRPASQTLTTALDLEGHWEDAFWQYEVVSKPNAGDPLVAALADERAPASLERGFARSPAAPRVRLLAESLLGRAGAWPPERTEPERWAWNRRAARIFAAHLQSGAYTYTLDISDVVRRTDDPIADFLFESRRGHCEYFASALAALCQTVGVDARLATGYVVDPAAGAAGEYVVLESGAHAWVEVRAGRFAFDTVDPTPPGVLDGRQRLDDQLAGSFDQIVQRLESFWTTYVVQFDERTQGELLDAVTAGWRARFAAFVRATDEWMARVNRAFYFGPAGYIWLGIVALAAMIAVAAVVRTVRRYRQLRRVLQPDRLRSVDRRRVMWQLGFYLDMLHELRRAGLPKPAWQPPRAFAQTIEAERPAVAQHVEEITTLFYAARYAGRPLSREDQARGRLLVTRLANLLRASA